MALHIVEHITHQGIRHIAAHHPDWQFGEGRRYPYWQIANATVMETAPFLNFFRTSYKASPSAASLTVEAEATPRPKRKVSPLKRGGYNTRIDGKTAVYRLYDKSDRLLYTGVSMDPERRWKEHASLQLWWHLAVRKEVTWCDSRDEALVMEEEIERLEDPKFGDTHLLGAGWRTGSRRRDPALDAATQHTTDLIRTAILAGEYAEGSYMPRLVDLAKRYDVSKAMISTALSRLCSERLLSRNVRYIVKPQGGES
ncbi:GntR family transcriptional regulator [Streptomyces halstedii]|uniref:GntR family transcriptional regulator n=1 Tax=Streptomyces halstedii TaxID=1944 RepID=UPI00380E8257